MFGKRRPKAEAEVQPRRLLCSFCNRTDREVRKLIAGPTVFICDECVDVCVEILREDTRVEGSGAPENPVPPGSAWPAKIWCSLCRMALVPEEALLVPERGLVCRPCVSAV